MSFTPAARPGVLHNYSKGLVAFEHASPTAPVPPNNTLIFIGGLFDGLLTVPYATSLAHILPASYSLVEILFSSSYAGWGVSSLAKDASQIAECVAYFKSLRPGGRIVLMGHSTGCQDVMEYLVGPGHEKRETINGAIIQAPVSDREAMVEALPPGVYERSCAIAKHYVDDGKGEDIMPGEVTASFFGSAVSARRWLSLASPDHDGDDDFFSSDLSLEKLQGTFGKLPKTTPMCIIYSGNDEFAPKFFDKAKLVKKWLGIIKEGGGVADDQNSGVVEGAAHNLIGSPEKVVADLISRVVRFLQTV
ncbi:MAG: hypothetical protein M1819_003914 [Sarea resinae]|nr:MAG: hypothetical protein M1819_003914 [Sarea resinae]